jgi:DNA repair protein RadC
VRDLTPSDRPREKLDQRGAVSLGDNELLALVLGHGFRAATALDLANTLLRDVGGLHGLARASVDDLRRVKGVGSAKAAQIIAALEIGRRTLARVPAVRVQITTPRAAAAYLLPQFGAKTVEHFGVLLLDTKRRVLRTALLSIGTLDASIVHPRDVFRAAMTAHAASIVLFHNHPSGDPLPSPDDVELTRRLVRAGELMGIEVVDHIILAEAAYYSFKERREL